MLTEELFESVLIRPVHYFGADTLHVVSGYATAAFMESHVNELVNSGFVISVDLVIGMARKDGISSIQHKAFCEYCDSGEDDHLYRCSYLCEGKPVHSKVYIWCRQQEPVVAFLGSANYTYNGFSGAVGDSVALINPFMAINYFRTVKQNSIDCNHAHIDNVVKVFDTEEYTRRARPIVVVDSQLEGDEKRVKLSLLTREGEVHQRSGLNWGQRDGRNANQAYIPIPASIYANSNFFPPREVKFTVMSDDGEIFTVARAQDGGKALHTPYNNAQLGSYFRKRMGLEPGQFVTKDNLLNYGRTHVEFTKLSDEEFIMDFSVSN